MNNWNELLPSSHTDTFARDRLPPQDQWPLFIADRPELAYPDTLNAATESAQQIIDMAVQMHGGMGVKKGVMVESLYREIRALRIYEGATEVQQLIIGKDVLKG